MYIILISKVHQAVIIYLALYNVLKICHLFSTKLIMYYYSQFTDEKMKIKEFK